MTEKINREEIVETGRRNLERNLFESNRAIIDIQEVRRDENGNFVPVSKTNYRRELSGNNSISILIKRYIRKVYPGECFPKREGDYPKMITETETKEPIVLERGGITYVVGVRKEILVSEVDIGSIVSVGKYDVSLFKEGYDEMIRQEVKLYMKRAGGIINRRYAVAIKNVGGKGQVIKVYDERGNKIGDIAYGEEALLRKGAYYLEFPGTHSLEGLDRSLPSVFFRVILRVPFF